MPILILGLAFLLLKIFICFLYISNEQKKHLITNEIFGKLNTNLHNQKNL